MSDNQMPVGGAYPASQDDAGWNPPSGNLSLDDLFPNPELAGQQPAAEISAPAPPAPPEYFLKAATGTVYKTIEDAVRGTEEKDRTIERQKQELAQIKAQTQPQPTTQAAPGDYQKQVFKRLAEAAQKNDETGYMNTLAEFQMSVLQQFAPALSGVVEDNAIRQVESESKDFRSWLSGPEYSRTLEQFPILAQAISTAKSDPRMAHQLSEFYRLAYRANVAEHANEIATTAARGAAPAPTPTRPTLSANTPTPVPSGMPQRSAQLNREQILSDRNARQEWLKRFREERGQAMDVSFGEVGL